MPSGISLRSSLPRWRVLCVEVINELRSISKLPDAEIIALTELKMEPEADHRLSVLLEQQQAGRVLSLRN